MRRTHVFSLVICMCLVPMQLRADGLEVRRLPLTTLEILRLDWRKYPELTIECVAVCNGQPIDLSQRSATSAIMINESGIACSVMACVKAGHPAPLRVDFFLALGELDAEDLKALQTAVQSTVDFYGRSFEPYYFVARDTQWVPVTVSHARELQRDSVPDSGWTNALLQKVMARDSSVAVDGNRLGILVADKISKQIRDVFSNKAGQEQNHARRIGLLVRDADLLHSVAERMSQCGFVAELDVKVTELEQTLKGIIGENLAAQCPLRFLSPAGHSLKTEREYQLLIDESTGALERACVVSIPDSVIRAGVRRWHENEAEDLVRQGRFTEASDSLWCAHKLLKDPEIKGFAAKTLLQEWSKKARDSGFTAAERKELLHHGDEVWHFSEEEPWYKKLKNEILDSLLRDQPGNNEAVPQRLALLKQREALLTDKTHKAETAALIGDVEYEHNSLWLAVKSYGRSLQYTPNERIAERQRRVVQEGLAMDFAGGRLADLYQNGLEYQKHFAGSFPHRYMFAVSCVRSGDYVRARTEYEWLTYNWDRSQNLISWEGALAQLQDLYGRTFQFENAFRMNQRLYRQNSKEDVLRQALRSLRAQFLAPIAVAFPSLMERVGHGGIGPFFEKKNLVVWPHFLTSYFYVDSKGRATHVAGRQNPARLELANIPRLAGGITIVENTGADDVVRLIQQAGDGFFVLEFTSNVTEVEAVLLGAIRKAKSQDASWGRLVEHEQIMGARMLCELFGAMVATEMRVRGRCDISRYWRVTQERTPIIRYMVLHGEGGRVVQSCGFDSTQAAYRPGLWRKSSSTRAFFTQPVTYQKQPVQDVAVPVYIDAAWHGAARIGLTRSE